MTEVNVQIVCIYPFPCSCQPWHCQYPRWEWCLVYSWLGQTYKDVSTTLVPYRVVSLRWKSPVLASLVLLPTAPHPWNHWFFLKKTFTFSIFLPFLQVICSLFFQCHDIYSSLFSWFEISSLFQWWILFHYPDRPIEGLLGWFLFFLNTLWFKRETL